MSDFIHFTDVLKWIEARDSFGKLLPFSLKYVKADVNRNSGGHEVAVPQAVLYARPGGSSDVSASASSDVVRNPNHFDHDTINIMLLPSKQIRKVHTRLITSFNNQPVFY